MLGLKIRSSYDKDDDNNERCENDTVRTCHILKIVIIKENENGLQHCKIKHY